VVRTATGGRSGGTVAKRVINVWHIGAWNRNFGDWALAYQMHRLLNEQAASRDLHLSFYLVDAQHTYFHRRLVDQMCEEADLVIVGGGGCLFHRPEDSSRSGWMFNISLEDLDRITAPIVVYAIGYNRFAYDPDEFPPITTTHLGRLQDRAMLFSARNTGTRAIMAEEFGLRAETIDVVPDPGIYMFDRAVDVPSRRPGAPLIAVNLAGDRPGFRYPAPVEDNQRRFVEVIKGALSRCVRDLGAQIMFLPHLVGVDTDLFAQFADGFPRGSIFSAYEELPFLYPPPMGLMYAHVPFFTNLFRQSDVVLGMRGHSGILSFGTGTKFISLGEHRKLGYFASDVGLPAEYAIQSVGQSEGAVGLVFDKVHGCLEDEAYAQLLGPSLDRQRAILRAFNERVLDVAVESERNK